MAGASKRTRGIPKAKPGAKPVDPPKRVKGDPAKGKPIRKGMGNN